MMSKLTLIAAGLCVCLLAGCTTVAPNEPAVTTMSSSSSYAKTFEVEFNGSGTFTWPSSGAQPSLVAVEMTYADGVGGVNTFDLNYTRDSVERDLVGSVAVAMRTFTWYLPAGKFPQSGDVWSFSNTLAGDAILTIDVEYK